MSSQPNAAEILSKAVVILLKLETMPSQLNAVEIRVYNTLKLLIDNIICWWESCWYNDESSDVHDIIVHNTVIVFIDRLVTELMAMAYQVKITKTVVLTVYFEESIRVYEFRSNCKYLGVELLEYLNTNGHTIDQRICKYLCIQLIKYMNHHKGDVVSYNPEYDGSLFTKHDHGYLPAFLTADTHRVYMYSWSVADEDIGAICMYDKA